MKPSESNTFGRKSCFKESEKEIEEKRQALQNRRPTSVMKCMNAVATCITFNKHDMEYKLPKNYLFRVSISKEVKQLRKLVTLLALLPNHLSAVRIYR